MGLVDDERWTRFQEKEESIEKTSEILERSHDENGSLLKFLRRPEVDWKDVVAKVPALAEVDPEVAEQVETDAKYAGYIERQELEIARQKHWNSKKIPANFSFSSLPNLRAEAKERLERVRPTNLGQASRIPGVRPADISVLTVALEQKERNV